MSSKSFTTALTLYRSRTYTLEQAAGFSGLSTGEMASALRSRGIDVREADEQSLPESVGR
ncbi:MULTISPECIES: DUF7317 family protein [Haloarcula]|uniref:Uncharacterized protein n=1 Tax=Haloarcula pellucida TaxID=1427151 RepID=A0A830GQQ7_9EURY|nr:MULTISPECIES: UPF0175 family protein [Halomicroarcula]MBX0349478.1 UPF0175 family protein [Halomicroarcula pellucida]MDS0278939.1 UPF0175 family protein [Halomicroarcula sp. S1AR25-4]QIO21283.1 hypothetical protein G9465_02475 [Haloarcula sp. JP-L23]GGO02734.1 hypothetical protein GCM10009030_37650 [Halomicroarcula pellucida]